MKRILIVSAFWVPRIHVATNRVQDFAKYFKNTGFEVTVLTLQDSTVKEAFVDSMVDGLRVIRLKSDHLLNRSNFSERSSFVTHKLKALKNKILNRFVDDDTPGFYFSFLKLKEKLQLNQFDYVLSSYAPLSTHLIALNMKLTNPQMKWIADFRDEMSFLPGLSEIVKTRLLACEKQILKECDYVTTVSQPILDQFKTLESKPTFLEMRNGYDFELVTEAEKPTDVFKIVYAGTFHGAMNPNLFLQAIVHFKQRNPEKKFAVNFFCGTEVAQIPSEVKENVNCFEKVSYAELPERLKEASLFLLIHGIMPRN